MADLWGKADLGHLVPGFVSTLITPAKAAVSGVAGLLTAAQGGLQAAKAFLDARVDPAAALVGTLLTQIDAALGDLQNTGVYFTCVAPRGPNDRSGLNRSLRDIIASIYDQYDANRPQFTPGEAVGAVLLCAGGPDLQSVLPSAGLLDTLFNLNQLKMLLRLNSNLYVPTRTPFPQGGGVVTTLRDDLDPRAHFVDVARVEKIDRFARLRLQFQSGNNVPYLAHVIGFEPETRTFLLEPLPYPIARGDIYQLLYPQFGRPPDWQSVRVIDFVPALSPILAQMQSLTRLLASETNAAAHADLLIDAVGRKATQMQRCVDAIDQHLSTLKSSLSAAGLSCLPLDPEVGGVDHLCDRLLSAKDAPDWRLDRDFTVCAIAVCNAVAYPVMRRLL